MIGPHDMPVPAQMLLHPELTALTTLETALEMTTVALFLSYPEITDYHCTGPSDPELCAIEALLGSIRDLQRSTRAFRRLIVSDLAPDVHPEDNLDDVEPFEIDDDIPF
jgi:hypothetical protein